MTSISSNEVFKPEFPMCWDNSLRSAFIECPRAAYWGSFHHYKPRAEESVHLHAGKAWAHCLEVVRELYYAQGLSPQMAQAAGLETLIQDYGDFQAPERGSGAAKSLDRLVEAFAYYWKAFPLETDPAQPYRTKEGKPMVEFSFAIPLSDDLRHPVTDEPIIYAGRADMIATYAGAVTIYDDKTTGSLGSQWAQQWNRRAQFTGYAWAANAFGIPASQVLVRGIAILKTEIKHAEAITVRTPHHIAEWHTQFIRDVRRAIECWKTGYWDVNLSDGCSSYGGCAFQQPCMSNNPEPWLKGQFIRKQWDPITRTETLLDHD